MRLLILTLLIPLFTFCQIEITDRADIKWGEEIKFKKGTTFKDYIGKDKKNYFLIKSIKRGDAYAINSFDKNLKLKNEVIIDMKIRGGSTMDYEAAYLIQNEIFIFSSFADKKTRINKLYCRTFDKDTFKAGKLTEIAELPYEKKRKTGGFGLEISDDEETLLIYLNKPYQKNAPERYGFTIIDKDLNKLWEKDIELPYTEQFFIIENYTINNDGDVYLLGQEFKEDKKDRIKGKPNYKYHVLAYLDKGKKVKDYEINLEDKFITDITFKVAKNGDLICSGLYSKNGTSGVKGAFYMVIDFETRQIKNNSLKEFDESFITQGWSDKAITKAKKKEIKKDKAIELYEYDLKDFILREDGGAVLVAEQYYVRVVTTTTTDSQGRTTTRTTYHYYYNDIIVVNITPKGRIEWATKIEKNQHSVNDGGYLSSYALQVIGDQLFFIFNESARTYFEKEERKEMNRKDKKAYLTILTTVESNGEYEKEILVNVSEESTYPVPKLSGQISDNEMMLYTRKGKRRRFALATFK